MLSSMPPPTTRRNTNIQNEEFYEYLDKKFEEFESNMLVKLKNELKQEIKEVVAAQNKEIELLQSTVSLLQQHVKVLKQSLNSQAKNTEDLAQYGRRNCLRIDGIPYEENESANEVLDIVRKKVNECEIDIPDIAFDRAHRIGPKYDDRKTKIKMQSILVKFTTFRHRTLFYRSRKKLSNNVKIRLDLTKVRYDLLNMAREYVEHKTNVKFVFADINCRLNVRKASDEVISFDNLDRLKQIVKEWDEEIVEGEDVNQDVE